MNIPRDKKFYEVGEWADLLAEKHLSDYPREVKERFIRESIEDSHRREYYWALNFYNHEGPDWEDLTDEQRENIRKINRQHAQEMTALAQSLSQGINH